MDNTFTATIERCGMSESMPGGWHIVSVPPELSAPLKGFAAHFGFIAITAKVGRSTWPTSLLPSGDGTYLIALPAKVRTKEKLAADGEVEISFEPRVK